MTQGAKLWQDAKSTTLRKSTGCDAAWRTSFTLAAQMEARAHVKTRRSSEEARPSADLGESIRSEIVIARGGPAALQYLAVSGRLEENIKCNRHPTVFAQKPSKARNPPESAQRPWRLEVFVRSPQLVSGI